MIDRGALPSSAKLAGLHAHARQMAALLRLPFRRRAWHGTLGNWQGIGTGSSLDFQDHRPYSPGDDPRYINWQAYARSGHYTMKLYRQEVSPAVDIAIDLSASMFLDETKAARTAELFYWCIESALQTNASLRCFGLRGANAQPISLEAALAHSWLAEEALPVEPAAVRGVPWRQGALRIFLSDLLWPGDAQTILQTLTESSGAAVVIAPFCRAEAEPDWTGNLEMVDCESGALRIQRVNGEVLRRYRAAWARHFELWEDQALRYRVPLARVAAEPELAESLRAHLAIGAVELAG
jgi:hypothetical protein